jgi:flagellar hook-basal body complex protein FliE
MMTDPLAALAPIGAAETSSVAAPDAAARTSNFAELVMAGISGADQQSGTAMQALADYAVGNPVSPHEMMIALEQARLSVQLTVEVRNRLVEAYQELSRMQI